MVAIATLIFKVVVTIGAAVGGAALRKAAQDPQMREQMASMIYRARSGVSEVSPAARARLGLLRDLDALVSLARSRRAAARDPEEEKLADRWVREAENIRGAADIAEGLPVAENRSLTEQLELRRLTLERRMLSPFRSP